MAKNLPSRVGQLYVEAYGSVTKHPASPLRAFSQSKTIAAAYMS